MKSILGTVKIVVIAVVAVLAGLSFRSFAQPNAAERDVPERKITLKFKDAQVKNEDNFKAKLCRLGTQQFDVKMKHSDATKPESIFPPCAVAKSDIKTDKITTSVVVKNSAADEYTVIGPHVTQKVTSATKAEIQGILDELQ